jgi:hypothetical protein
MFTRFFTWLGAVLSNEQHPLTRSMADCMRFLGIAGLAVVVAGTSSILAADDYGMGEKLADVVTLVAGAAGWKAYKG